MNKSKIRITPQRLIAAAQKVRERAHAPFSKFKVGAALLASSGKTYTGCNIENVSFGLTLCAERVALAKAISEGETDFRALAVVTDGDQLTPPCGPCRQMLWEFCRDVPVILANLNGGRITYQLSDLFPVPFDDFKPEALKPAPDQNLEEP